MVLYFIYCAILALSPWIWSRVISGKGEILYSVFSDQIMPILHAVQNVLLEDAVPRMTEMG